MNHKIIILILLFFGILLPLINAQKNDKKYDKKYDAEYKKIKPLIDSAYAQSIRKNSMAVYQTFMDTVKVVYPNVKQAVIGTKANLLMDFNEKKLDEYEPQKLDKELFIKVIIDVMQQAIDSCEECSLKNMVDRYEFLKAYRIGREICKKDSLVIFSAGYKSPKEGKMLGLHISQGKDTWIGGEFAFFSKYEPSYRLKKWNKSHTTYEKGYSKKWAIVSSVLSFAYAYNWKQKIHDFSFNPVQLIAPLVLKPLQFGLQKRAEIEESYEPYYRPEIGLGFGKLSVSAGYNIMLRKSARANGEKWMFNISYIFPFDSHKKAF